MNKSEKIRKALEAGKDAKTIAGALKVPVSYVYNQKWKMKKDAAKKKRVVMTSTQVKLAKKLNVPLDAYARELLKTQNQPTKKASDTQIGGSHYKQLKVEPWDAMEAWMTKDAFAGFLRGNAIKYLARTDKKGGVEDLKKARHYLDKLIEVEEGK